MSKYLINKGRLKNNKPKKMSFKKEDTMNKKLIKKGKLGNKANGKGKAKGKNKTPFIHDTFFKDVYSEPKYSLDLFRLVLSKREQALFDWNTLKFALTTFIDERAREKRVDLLFSVNLKNSNKKIGVLFLLEHKSSEDPKTLIQLLEYQTTIYRKERIPIIPILFYHGKKKEWKLPLNFHDILKDFKGRLRRRFKKDVLNFRYRLLNVQKLDINTEAKGLTSQVVLFIFKNIWNLGEGKVLDESKIEELFTLSDKLSEEERKSLGLKAINYAQRYYPDFNWEVLLEERGLNQIGGGTMSLWQDTLDEEREKWLKKGLQAGRQEGLQAGRQTVILNMLKEKLDLSVISKVTGLSEAEIKKLKNGQ